MKRLFFVAALLACTPAAQAAVLKNLDKDPVKVTVKNAKKTEVVTLDSNESIRSKQNGLWFIVGTQRVQAHGEEGFMVQGGKLEGSNEAGTQALAAVKKPASAPVKKRTAHHRTAKAPAR